MVISVFIIIVLMNIVFGYWRSNTRRFSLPWILSIHVPVLLEIGLRMALLGMSLILIPLFVGAFVAGQYTGGSVRRFMKKSSIPLSSFLLADLSKLVASRYKK